MNIHCRNKETFYLTYNSELLGSLHYTSEQQFEAKIKLSNDYVYEIKPIDNEKTKMLITENKKEVGILHLTLSGNFIILYSGGVEFTFKAKGTQTRKYTVEDKTNSRVMMFHPSFNDTANNFNYSISYDNRPNDNLLILLSAYCANYFSKSILEKRSQKIYKQKLN